MKKFIAMFLVLGALTACNNSGDNGKDAIDSLEERKDTLMENVDSTAEAKIDSIKDRTENLKDKFDSSIEAKKDSIKQ